ncbi:MAG: glutamate formimidoyltransferase [Flavobacteriaceae bacterium]|nr:glutamate formimidoyltransferase [Flavobacteriaceae bacterium]
MKRLLECVPNISEGCDTSIINAIADEIRSVEGVKLLNIDSGKAANRTVYTFIGIPEKVVEASFRMVQKALELIDMRHHQGRHPRLGAVDVCPFVPVQNVTMEEAVEYAHQLGERVGTELGIPIYFYANASKNTQRQNLASCRSGQYEGLKEKLQQPKWKPDFGTFEFTETVAKFGAMMISARDFLVAYNVNLNTTSAEIANDIASVIRESGRVKRDAKTGEKLRDTNGKLIRIKGKLKAVRSIGWYIDDFKKAQVSCNLTDYKTTPMHLLFEEIVQQAKERGVEVTGSEVIGLLPLQTLLQAGGYFLEKEHLPTDISEIEKVRFAIEKMGLNEVKSFTLNENIVEYAVKLMG